MNEKIKVLADQAVLDSLFESIDPAFTVGTGNGKMTIPLVFAEKFAELIIRECSQALFNESERLFGLYLEENDIRSAVKYEIQSEQCIDNIALIEKHFGVKE